MKLIVLASGMLGAECLEHIAAHHSIVYVFTDKTSHKIIEWVTDRKLPIHIGNPRKLGNYEFLMRYDNAYLVSINYLFLITQNFIDVVQGRAINIHGALLPKYRGRTPHIWSIINGEKTVGITIHKLIDKMDAGDILLQDIIPVSKEDTGGTILDQFRRKYPELLQKALLLIENASAVYTLQDQNQATYFPKRAPEDGLINWNWQNERIYNWVRALTKPYPGAFTVNTRNGKRIIVWHCAPDDTGFNGENKNGMVLQCREKVFYVKCPNRVIKVDDYEGIVNAGDILG